MERLLFKLLHRATNASYKNRIFVIVFCIFLRFLNLYFFVFGLSGLIRYDDNTDSLENFKQIRDTKPDPICSQFVHCYRIRNFPSEFEKSAQVRVDAARAKDALTHSGGMYDM